MSRIIYAFIFAFITQSDEHLLRRFTLKTMLDDKAWPEGLRSWRRDEKTLAPIKPQSENFSLLQNILQGSRAGYVDWCQWRQERLGGFHADCEMKSRCTLFRLKSLKLSSVASAACDRKSRNK